MSEIENIIVEKKMDIPVINPVLSEADVTKKDPEHYTVYFSIPVKDFKNMLTVYKPFINEIKLFFRNNEIFISHVDPAHVCMLTEKIPVKSLLEYKIFLNGLTDLELSLDLDKLFNMFKSSEKNDVLTFCYDSINNKIVNISIGSFKYVVDLLDNSLVQGAPKIPILNLPSSFEIEVKTVNTFLGQADNISDYMSFKTSSNDLTLSAANIDNNNNVNLVLTRDQINFLNSNSNHESKFSIEYMINIFKGLKTLFNKVNIDLGDNNPLRITGCGISELTVLLAPRIEEV